MTATPYPGGQWVGAVGDEPVDYPVVGSVNRFLGQVWSVKTDTVNIDGHVVDRDFVVHTGAVAVAAIDDEVQAGCAAVGFEQIDIRGRRRARVGVGVSRQIERTNALFQLGRGQRLLGGLEGESFSLGSILDLAQHAVVRPTQL